MTQRDFQGAIKGLDAAEFAHLPSAPMVGTLKADMGADVVTSLMGSLRSHRRHTANQART